MSPLVVSAFMLLTLPAALGHKAASTVRIGVWEHPPLMKDRAPGRIGPEADYGYCYSLVSKTLKMAGYKTIAYYAPAASLVKQAKAHRLDAVCAFPRVSDAPFYYSKAEIANLNWKVWIREEDARMRPPEGNDLKFVSITEWDFNKSAFQPSEEEPEKVIESFALDGRNAPARAFMMLDSKRADAVRMDRTHAKHILTRNIFSNRFTTLPGEPFTQKALFAVSKSCKRGQKLLADFERFYAKALKQGLVKRLKRKYFGGQ